MTPREAFLADRARRSPKTREGYGLAIDHLERMMAHRGIPDMASLPATALKDYVSHLEAVGAGGSTRPYLSSLKQFLAWCREKRIQVGVAPFESPTLARQRRVERVVLRSDALRQYLVTTGGVAEPYRTAMWLLPMTGLRINEMTRLKMDDVYVGPLTRKDGTSYIGASLSIRGVSGATAKSKADRTVPVLLSGLPYLRAYLERVRPGLPGTDWLFPQPLLRRGRPTPISARQARSYVAQVKNALGLPHLTPHTLRHTYATRLAEYNVPVSAMQALLGHESMATTGHYIHENPQTLHRAVENVPALDPV